MKNSNDKSQTDPTNDAALPFDSLKFQSDKPADLHTDDLDVRSSSPSKFPSGSHSSSDEPLSLQPLHDDQQDPATLRGMADSNTPKAGPAPGSKRDANTHSLSAGEIRQQRREAARQQQLAERAKSAPRTDAGGLSLFLLTATMVFGLWFAGPRLVEEYHYAATAGKTRAEYEHASAMLESDPLASVSYAYQMVAQKVRPSVVSITAFKRDRSTIGNRGLGEEGLGSGVIVSDDGYILTNKHVLDGGYRFFVELHDRRRFSAALIGDDKDSDLALLKIQCDGLLPASWGDSDALDVGSIVWAFGNPYQLKQTVTSGIISGKDRPGDLNAKQALLQTDAAINKGNSGGPLVDSRGHVIGINTAILGETFQGIGFAVPSSTARYVVEQLKINGRVTRGFLGVRPVEVSNADVRRLDLPDLNGAKLDLVEAGSPAASAGIRSSDVIREWNGVPIRDYKALFRLTEMTPPNSTVKVTLIRDGQEFETTVRVGNRDSRYTR